MNKDFLDNFRKIIDQFGITIFSDSRKLEGLLRDFNPDKKREIKLIMELLKAGAVSELNKLPGNMISEFDMLRIINKISYNTWISEESVRLGLSVIAGFYGKNIPAQNNPVVTTITSSNIIVSPQPAVVVYDSVKIGDQIWMTKNLDVSVFRNGEPVPEVFNKDDWMKACADKKPACCCYDFDSDNGKKFGKLYNWFAVIDSRKLAPEDWFIPTFPDMNTLVNVVGPKINDYEALGHGTYNSKGTNKSGLTVLLSGHLEFSNNSIYFHEMNVCAHFWCSNSQKYLRLHDIFSDDGKFRAANEFCGKSIRCLRY